ncbi:hypothetical protein [Thermacetogenium phaeum]|uniref:hypothetical protein n=1 Tax=Thermacetogenium phaeum TaxID=85874 RepID=UPI0002E70392|nr:hypothetical protein [Thermacetogenium phaeum]
MDHHAAGGGTNRGKMVYPCRRSGDRYLPLAEEQQTAAESRQNVERGDSAAGMPPQEPAGYRLQGY